MAPATHRGHQCSQMPLRNADPGPTDAFRTHRCPQGTRWTLLDPWVSSRIHGCPQTHTIYPWDPRKSSGSTDVPWTHGCPPGPTDAPTKPRCPPGPTDVTRTCRCHQHTQKPLAPTRVPRTHMDGTHGCHQKTQMCLGPTDVSGTWGCSRDPQKPTRTCAHTPRKPPGPTDATKPPRCPLIHGCPLKPLGPWVTSGCPSSPWDPPHATPLVSSGVSWGQAGRGAGGSGEPRHAEGGGRILHRGRGRKRRPRPGRKRHESAPRNAPGFVPDTALGEAGGFGDAPPGAPPHPSPQLYGAGAENGKLVTPPALSPPLLPARKDAGHLPVFLRLEFPPESGNAAGGEFVGSPPCAPSPQQ